MTDKQQQFWLRANVDVDAPAGEPIRVEYELTEADVQSLIRREGISLPGGPAPRVSMSPHGRPVESWPLLREEVPDDAA